MPRLRPLSSLAVILLLVMGIAPPVRAQGGPAADSLTRIALRFLPPNNPIRQDSAMVWVRRALAVRPSARGHAVLADAWAWAFTRAPRETAARDSAVAQLAAARRLDPDDAHAFYVEGLLAGLAGDSATAIERYRRSLARDPDHEMAGGNLVTVLDQIGRTAEALTLGESYLTRPHQNRRILFRTGWVLGYLWESARAEAVFRRLIAMDPGGIYDAWGHGEIAYMRRARGDGAGAVAAMAEAVASRPDDAISRVGLEHFRLNMGQYREAIPRLTEKIRLDPAARAYGNTPAVLLLGWAYLQAGDTVAARRVLDPYEARMRQAGTLEWLVPLLSIEGRVEEAVAVAERLPPPRHYGSPTPNDRMLDGVRRHPTYAAIVKEAQARINAKRTAMGLRALVP